VTTGEDDNNDNNQGKEERVRTKKGKGGSAKGWWQYSYTVIISIK
jgi:hypothetical protein